MMMLPAIAIILSAHQQAAAILPATELDPPPAAIADLAASNPTETTVRLQWMAPADTSDQNAEEVGPAGPGIRTSPALAYDLRYSLVDPATVGSSWWNDATPSTDDDGMQPQVPGTGEEVIVTGLASGYTYYFAIKSRDGVSDTHWSALSNIASATTVALPFEPPAPAPTVEVSAHTPSGGCGSSAAGQVGGALLILGILMLRGLRA